MTEYVVFENQGEIDPLLIKTFGVNVKESESAIGFFGTGLKYALAILARHDCEVVIQSGLTIYQFGKQSRDLRGKSFEFVTMNGEPMGFTTEVGKTWALWMAYRELYCNAKDEDGRHELTSAYPEPKPGTTRVVVAGENFADIARAHDEYFLSGEPILRGLHADVYAGSRNAIFYRGVNVGKVGVCPTLYTYNLRGQVSLTEDRVIKSTFDAESLIARTIFSSDDPDFVRNCLTAPEGYFERDMDYHWTGQPSKTFMSTVEALIHDRLGNVNASALRKYRESTQHKSSPPRVELNVIETKTLEKAKAFCERLGFPMSYPIVTVESLGEHILGMASRDEQTIYLSQRAFMMGTKTVAGTLIEEYIHLKHNLDDMTRGFQNFIIDRLVSQGELLTGEPL